MFLNDKLHFFSPVRGRYLAMYSYTDTIYIICEFEIYETVPEFPGNFYVYSIYITNLHSIIIEWKYVYRVYY